METAVEIVDVHADAINSGTSWAAIAAGAVAAAALTLVLVALGAGLGLSSISPWSDGGVSAATFEIGTGIYLVVVAVISSAIGGYLAGRLRTKWVGLHSNEVFFRDTAHGFLAWAFATLICATALASATSYLANGAAAGGAAHPHKPRARSTRRKSTSTSCFDRCREHSRLLPILPRAPTPSPPVMRPPRAALLAHSRRAPKSSICGPPTSAMAKASRRAIEPTSRNSSPREPESQADAEKRVDQVVGRSENRRRQCAARRSASVVLANRGTLIRRLRR